MTKTPISSADSRKDPFVWVNIDFCELDIDPAAKAVYLEVARRARNSDGSGACWESVENIAHWANVSPRTARRSLNNLVKWNMLSREPRTGITSLYRLNDCSEWTAPKLKKPDPQNSENTQKQGRTKTTGADKNDRGQKGQGRTKTTGDPLANLAAPPLAFLSPKLDPIELDPIELDPFLLKQAEKEKSSQPIDSTTPRQPEPQNQAEDTSFSKGSQKQTVETKPIGQDQSAASASRSRNEFELPPLHPAVQMNDRFSRGGVVYPWRDGRSIESGFLDFVGRQLPGGDMHPKAKARAHIINAERSGDTEKVEGYWDDYQEVSRKNDLARQQQSIVSEAEPFVLTPEIIAKRSEDVQRIKRLNSQKWGGVNYAS